MAEGGAREQERVCRRPAIQARLPLVTSLQCAGDVRQSQPSYWLKWWASPLPLLPPAARFPWGVVKKTPRPQPLSLFLPPLLTQARLKHLKKTIGTQKLGEVTVDMAIGGMRGITV